ncbi:MAG: LamG domain-containing protein [Bacteroidales bacterium]|nr:LamG domain-containing protein [Bacteroidales bacterium]MCF8388718.1 LamG domain-containing protein [Bacteroidales bacterium]MCF8399709.1 LamG domain-containing protein [Bacteroidales bacterium]
MKKIKFLLPEKLIVLLIISLMPGLISFGQTREDTAYLPQVNIVSQNGFGPYIAGNEQDNLFVIDSLPKNTSKVTFRFIDVDSAQVGQEHVVEGQPLFYAYWSATMEELQLPLSSRLHIGVHYGTDSVANYFIPYIIYPDTLYVKASKGWGPFITNNYNLNDSLWSPVPELTNSFNVSNLPPRTNMVGFYICRRDSVAIDSLIVLPPNNQYLDSASFKDARMDNLPLSTEYLKIKVICDGGPSQGWDSYYKLSTCQQKPLLKCITEDGQTLIDSVKPGFQNQLGGHSLLIDSVKHAASTNFPHHQANDIHGVYSLDLASQKYSIETWVKPDMDELLYGIGGEMIFLKVDSVWGMAVTGNNLPEITFTLYSLFNEEKLAVANFNVSYHELLNNDAWHQITFVSYEKFDKKFYLNGAPMETQIYNGNITYLINSSSQVLAACKTQPFIMGGGNATSGRRSDEPTLVNAIDEIRIWDKALTAEEISDIYDEPVMQQTNLVGYWTFNDLNCDSYEVSDISYKCNNAKLYNGATLIPQYPGIQQSNYLFNFVSSNRDIFPLKYVFYDEDNAAVDSGTVYPSEGIIFFKYDIESLSYHTNRMRITEMIPGTDICFTTAYDIKIDPPSPIATPRLGWGNYYASSALGISSVDTGMLFNPITVNNFPSQTTKVTLGWENNGNLFDTVSFTSSSNPWAHSLSLNGIDNYIESDQHIQSPHEVFSLTFWFKTNTGKGGQMIGFAGDSKSPGERSIHGPYIKMKNDGAIEFNLPVGDSMATLIAANKFNDGKWHHLAACYKEQDGGLAKLYIDGTLTDQKQIGHVESFLVKFYMGKNFENKIGDERVAEYFQGSFSEFVLWNKMLDHKSINRQMFKPAKNQVGYNFFYYKLNERTGDLVHDSEDWGFHAQLKGSSQNWSYENQLSCITWNDNVLRLEPGEYDFFARVFAEDINDTGISYCLGRIHIIKPIDNYDVSYNFEEGLGYFDEGTKVINRLNFWTNYDQRNNVSNWRNNLVAFKLIDPKGGIIDNQTFEYFSDTLFCSLDYDMGEILTGSYLCIHYGYRTHWWIYWIHADVIPLFTRTILPPKVSGNFGPFDQWIAPGTMTQLDTFFIITEDYDDLDTVKARFFDRNKKQVAHTNGHKINDTTWHIVYNMASLPPPGVNMTIAYYLGHDPDPAVIQGPYHITIHRTRPKWFDFVPDINFHNIHEEGDQVTFSIKSQIEDNFQDVVSKLSIPSSVPFFGGASASIQASEIHTSLKYTKSEYKLKLMDKPVFNQTIFNLGSNSSKLLSTEFDTTNNQFYLQPETNNIIAAQNMSWSGAIHTKYDQVFDILKKIKEIVDIAEEIDVGSIVQPTFDIGFKGNYKFSSRLHLITDSLTGKWGSFGDLNVTANPNNPNYNKSASFHFYSGALGMEFTIGAKLLDGLAEADFSLDADFPLGFGESYRSIPHHDNHFLKSFGFRTYGKVVAKIFWGWYEKTVWGPKMFYSTTIWGDDMSDCFPDMEKINKKIGIKANSDLPELAGEIMPVTQFNKIPLAWPEANIASSDDYKVFTWLEKGSYYGERKIRSRMMKRNEKLFSPLSTIEINKHAINSPLSDAISANEALVCWAQTSYNNESFLKIRSETPLKSFFETQEIWFASYDLENDSLIQLEKLSTDAEVKSGIGRANPIISKLSDQKAMIIWQLADMDNHSSHIWYCLLTKKEGLWSAGEPQELSDYQGIQSDLRVCSPQDDRALLVWLNTSYGQPAHNCIMTSSFDGEEWLEPEILLDEEYAHYNYFDLSIDDNSGGLAVSSYVSEPDTANYESLCFIPWEHENGLLNTTSAKVLLTDTIFHLQYPKIAFGPEKEACIAVKREEIIPKDSSNRISQVDLFYTDLSVDTNNWYHLPLSEYVCDTTKAVSEIELTFIGADSLLMLTNEYPMTASNSKFRPLNGLIFGDPYMNLVLRSFKIDNNEIVDIQEGEFFTAVDEFQVPENDVKLHQNYPNPCIDQSIIGFELPEKLQIKLEVFNSGGFKIATLADQELSKGYYELKLNTAILKPGAYVYMLTTKYGKESMRMIVVK